MTSPLPLPGQSPAARHRKPPGTERLPESIQRWPKGPGELRLPRPWLYALGAVVRSAILHKCLELIESQTGSHPARPAFAPLGLKDFRKFCGLPSMRSIEVQLMNGERAGWIEREFPDRARGRGGYRVNWEKVAGTEDAKPREKRKPRLPKSVSVPDAATGSAEPKNVAVREDARTRNGFRVQPHPDVFQTARSCGHAGGCPLLPYVIEGVQTLDINTESVGVASVTNVVGPTTPIPLERLHGEIPDVAPAAKTRILHVFPDRVDAGTLLIFPADLLSNSRDASRAGDRTAAALPANGGEAQRTEPAAFASALARLFALAGKPVPTRRQAARVARSLAGRGLTCGGFLDWCGLDRGRVRRARGPGVLDSWIDEYASYVAAHAAIDAEIETAEREAAARRERAWAEYQAERPEAEPEAEGQT